MFPFPEERGKTMSEKPKYKIILYWSDDKWIAEVPELPGCIADGDTAVHALENIQNVISEWKGTGRHADCMGKLYYAGNGLAVSAHQ